MPALYELTDALREIGIRLEEAEGELTPELEAEFDGLQLAVDDKIEKVALYIREQLASADAVKSEEDRLQKLRHTRVNAASNLRAYLLRCMQGVGKERVKGSLVEVSLHLNPPGVDGELSESQLADLATREPQLVKRVPEALVLDRRAVLALVRAGNPAPDGLTITRETSVRIR